MMLIWANSQWLLLLKFPPMFYLCVKWSFPFEIDDSSSKAATHTHTIDYSMEIRLSFSNIYKSLQLMVAGFGDNRRRKGHQAYTYIHFIVFVLSFVFFFCGFDF